jgi:malonyl CoA-acyl carrier protein transacylase/phosphopantetheinyl transferase
MENEAELRAHVLGVNAVYEQLQATGGIPEGMLLATGGIDSGELARLVAATDGAVHTAMDNCPHQIVLCGTREAIAALQQPLRARGAICQELPFARAYHTPWFEVFCAPLRAYFDRVAVAPPSAIDVYSCVSARRFPADPDEIRTLISTQWAKTVRFRDTVEAMHRDGARIFVEVGPRSNLTSFIDDTLRGRDYIAIPTNVQHRSGLTQLNHLVGQLIAHGVTVNVAHLYDRRAPTVVDLRQPAPVAVRRRVALKSGLQPMRLPESWPRTVPSVSRQVDVPGPAAASPARPSVPALSPAPVAPPVPAAPPLAGALAAQRSAGAVMEAHLRTMATFLDVQSRTMSAYLRQGRTAVPRRLPFIDAVQHREERSVTAVVRLDLDRHPFLNDHTLGRDVSVTDPSLRGLPVLPLTFTLEILAEAATLVAPGVVTSIEHVRASRWIRVASPVALIVSAVVREGAPGVVDVRARLGDAAMQPYGPTVIEAAVHLSPTLPTAPLVDAFVPRSARPSMWTSERLYHDGMFHGPAFRAVQSIDAFGDDGVSATLVAPAPRALFAEDGLELLTDAVLLDAAGQALAFWAKEHLGPHIDMFPFAVAAIRVFQPPPRPGTPVRCDVRAALDGDRFTTCDIDIVDGQGCAVYRITGWQDRRFELPPSLLQLRISPLTTSVATPWEAPIAGIEGAEGLACCRVDTVSEEWIEANQGIWGETLAHLILGRREREQWAALTGVPKRRHEWLLGRVAAKDAVRRLLASQFGLIVAAADVEIAPDANGRPEVQGGWRERIGVTPVVSIAHSAGVGVALAALDGRPFVGIDVESLSRCHPGFELAAFTSGERDLVSPLNEEQRGEWYLRLWCAKEAVGKALGRGLAGGVSALKVESAGFDDGAVTLTIGAPLDADFPELRNRGIVTYTARDGDYVSSAIVDAR